MTDPVADTGAVVPELMGDEELSGEEAAITGAGNCCFCAGGVREAADGLGAGVGFAERTGAT